MPTVKEKAIELLARREHSRQELRDKLKLRGYLGPEIEDILTWLESERYLDETRFIESYVRHRVHMGMGPLKIAYELKIRGITSYDLFRHSQWTGMDWLEQIRQVFKRKYKSAPKDRDSRAKCMRFLRGRGFTTEQIVQVLK